MADARRPTRREFVKSAAQAGLAAAAFSVSPLGSLRAWSDERRYDYIVVGSGAGGGTLACRLAQLRYRVLLIEAGSAETTGKRAKFPFFYPREPIAHAFSSDDPALAWAFYVNHYKRAGESGKKSHYTDDMNRLYQRDKGGIYYPRGSTVGGSTAINAMITLYPDHEDWNEMGAQVQDDKLWNANRMWQMFYRLDHAQFGGPKNPQSNSRDEWVREVLEFGNPWLRNERVNPEVVGFDTVAMRLFLATAAGCYFAGGSLQRDFRAMVRDIEKKLLHDFEHPSLKEFPERVRALFQKVHPNTWDYVSKKTEGMLDIPKATLEGRRFGTRDFIEKTLEQYGPRGSVAPGYFEILDSTLVTRVAIDKTTRPKPRALGVYCIEAGGIYGAAIEGAPRDPMGSERLIQAGEVILAGGAFNSPQLLMLSGIGPESELQKLPAERRVRELPGVGKNLQDRYEVTVTTELSEPIRAMAACKLGQESDPCLDVWNNDPAKSLYSSNGMLSAITARSSARGMGTPDLMVFMLGGKFEGYSPNYSHSAVSDNTVSWAVLKGHNQNTAGELTLKSESPTDTPKICFNYFDEGSPGSEQDLQGVVEGVNLIRDKLRAHLKVRWREHLPTENLDPKAGDPEAQIKDYVRRNAWGHHASSTCKMGPASDPMAVVDSRFKVHGVDGLRVADASVFPKLPGLFLAVPTYLIGEQAASVIAGDARKIDVF
jgi:choline dehydrogenase